MREDLRIFLSMIEHENLSKIDLSQYDDDNIHKSEKGSDGLLRVLCYDMYDLSLRIKCDNIECSECPLNTKADTIQFLKDANPNY